MVRSTYGRFVPLGQRMFNFFLVALLRFLKVLLRIAIAKINARNF